MTLFAVQTRHRTCTCSSNMCTHAHTTIHKHDHASSMFPVLAGAYERLEMCGRNVAPCVGFQPLGLVGIKCLSIFMFSFPLMWKLWIHLQVDEWGLSVCRVLHVGTFHPHMYLNKIMCAMNASVSQTSGRCQLSVKDQSFIYTSGFKIWTKSDWGQFNTKAFFSL